MPPSPSIIPSTAIYHIGNLPPTRRAIMKTSGLAARIASAIGHEIRENRLAPDTHLVAQTIADQHGVSRFPASEALALLVKQGFARKEPYRGVFVNDVSDLELTPE